MSTILVVEDEPGIAQLVADYLVVLDLGLPDRDGFDVTRELRRFTEVPIVMLTARGDESDRIVGLELGTDDYVVKPFSPKELVARVRAVLRRREQDLLAGPGLEQSAQPREIRRSGPR